MDADTSGESGPDPDEVVSLAEDYLEKHDHPPDPELKRVIKEDLDEWESRLENLEEDDPLRRRAETKYEEHVERWEEVVKTENGERERFLETVADSFVAEDFWLHPKILRALNFILLGKFSDKLVVKREVLEENSEFDDETLYEVSTKVREMAQKELDTLQKEED